MSPPQLKESDFWRQVRAKLANDLTHVCRVENDAGTGIFDVNACHHGKEVWIELKVLHGRRIHFRTSQKSWGVRRAEVGGRVLLLVRQDESTVLYDAWPIFQVTSTKVERDGKSFSIVVDDMPAPIWSGKKPLDWDGLRHAIFWPCGSAEIGKGQ